MWKDIDFWDIATIYQINEHGDIRNKNRNKLRKSHIDKYGYLNIVLYDRWHNRKNFKVHRLCAKAFIPTHDDKLEINHINGIKTDNRISNLEWVSGSENQIHARRHGLNTRNKLSESEIRDIVRLTLSGKSTREILNYFGIGHKGVDMRFPEFVKRIHKIRKHEMYKDIILETIREFNDYPLAVELQQE